jgi:uncharacterized protein YktB (UPF0637 family)
MPTNAQAALAAAANVYSGGRGHTTPAAVKLLAESFKSWLDHHDPEVPAEREVSLDALVERADLGAAPELRIGFAPRR